MRNSLLIPKSIKRKPSKVTLDNIYENIESLEKYREERESKLQSDLEAMLDNKFRSLEDKIQTLM
jgi:flagellar biosynthesis chaperone FliJ